MKAAVRTIRDFDALPRPTWTSSAAGINHQTWYLKVLFEGRDWAQDLLPLFEADERMRQREKVRNRHHPAVRLLQHRIQRPSLGVPALVTGNDRTKSRIGFPPTPGFSAETGGYLRVCTENRNWFEKDFPKWL